MTWLSATWIDMRSPVLRGWFSAAVARRPPTIRSGASLPVDGVVNESQLAYRRHGEHERIAVGRSKAAAQIVQYVGQRQPRLDHRVEVAVTWVQRIQRRLHSRLIAALGPQRQARGAGRLECIDYVHVVRPGFRPVLPRMHGGIGADEIALPVRRRTVPIMSLQSHRVVGAFVAEGRAEGRKLRTGRDQPIPEVMADLMTEVPQ